MFLYFALEEKQKFTLEEIAVDGAIILVDGSIKAGGKPGILWDVYDANKFLGLDLKKMRNFKGDIAFFEKVIENPYVFTIEEVCDEFFGLVEGLGVKIHDCLKTPKVVGRRARKKYLSDNNSREREETIKQMHERVFQCHRRLKTKVLKFGEPEKKVYNFLLDMIKTIEPLLMLKRDTGYIIGERQRDRSRDSDTDERIVATLLTLSLFSEKKPIGLTSDGDISRMVAKIPRFIGAEQYLPYNESFRNAWMQNPAKIYYYSEQAFTLNADTSEREFYRAVKLNELTPEQNWNLREKLGEKWKTAKDLDTLINSAPHGKNFLVDIHRQKH